MSTSTSHSRARPTFASIVARAPEPTDSRFKSLKEYVGPKLTRAEAEKIKKLKRQGWTIKAIAAETGRSITAVRKAILCELPFW